MAGKPIEDVKPKEEAKKDLEALVHSDVELIALFHGKLAEIVTGLNKDGSSDYHARAGTISKNLGTTSRERYLEGKFYLLNNKSLAKYILLTLRAYDDDLSVEEIARPEKISGLGERTFAQLVAYLHDIVNRRKIQNYVKIGKVVFTAQANGTLAVSGRFTGGLYGKTNYEIFWHSGSSPIIRPLG